MTDRRSIGVGIEAPAMHESGLATTVAATLRGQSLEGAHVRLLVRGGHAEPIDFDAAFRFHLASAAPDLEAVSLEIVHLPVDRLCVGCGETFEAVSGNDPCPACGGPGLAIDGAEHVELEVVGPDVDDS